MAFSISKKFSNQYWFDLNLSSQNSENWLLGIEVIEDRFNTRFFQHIDKIKSDEFSGFLTISIDCLLIETLMQFYLGVDNTEDCYDRNWKTFKDFLKNSIYFRTEFKTNRICKTFYSHFRCGLLHQAQTKSKSLIKICRENMLEIINPENITYGLIIDRNQFHSNLVNEFNSYIEKLKNNETNFKGENLREKAILKMDLICTE